MSRNKDLNIYAWQTGHRRATNVSTYGLDKAYPGQLQPELLSEYLRISQLWHRWLGLYEDDVIANEGKRKCQQEDIKTPEKKQQKTLEPELNVSPRSKKFLEM